MVAIAWQMDSPSFSKPQPVDLRCEYRRRYSAAMLPEDFMISNPQFAALNYRSNLNHSNYHALQAQVTARPINGVSLQGTWVWPSRCN
jgi:hypothetical protein